jgi:glutamate 5-kinase
VGVGWEMAMLQDAAGGRAEREPLHRLVVKIGSSTLAEASGLLNRAAIARLTDQVAALHAAGWDVVLVSSAAVAAGKSCLGDLRHRRDIPAKQMLAAIGQPRLMRAYDEAFARHGIIVAQALLTRHDLAERQGYLNARSTLLGLLHYRVVPIINENDVVATHELRFGDNDNLSAVVANLVDADLLLLLTDIDGLYTADPRVDPSARLIPEVSRIDAGIERLAGGTHPRTHGTGGMVTKLQAARTALRSGVTVVIANGGADRVIERVAQGEAIGTRFLPERPRRATAREAWLNTAIAAKGTLTVDDGAARVLREEGRSLLPAGVRAISGRFGRGDPVEVRDLAGNRLAYGLVNYSSADLARIIGLHSSAIEATLGYYYGDEVMHRNNLVLL